jgi:putative cardiolipin synthase
VTQPDQSYRVTLAPQPGGGPPALEWTGTDGGQTTTYHVDPHAGLLRNVMTGVFMLLPVDDQL